MTIISNGKRFQQYFPVYIFNYSLSWSRTEMTFEVASKNYVSILFCYRQNIGIDLTFRLDKNGKKNAEQLVRRLRRKRRRIKQLAGKKVSAAKQR